MNLPPSGLHLMSGEQAGAGDGDEGVAGFDLAIGPASKARVFQEASFEEMRERGERGAVEEIIGGVKEREAADEGVRQAFALQSRPGPGGVDFLKMVATM